MRRLPLFIAITWTTIVTFLLLLPGSEFPTITWLTRIWFDKWLHLIFFALLVIFWSKVISEKQQDRKIKRLLVWMATGWSVYGIVMEVLQHYFIPFRSFDWGDVVADCVGAIVGYMIATYWYIKK